MGEEKAARAVWGGISCDDIERAAFLLRRMTSPSRIEELLGHTEWLRKLAFELLGDAQVAEDVVQDTWVAYLEHPPRDESGSSGARAWLASVARNFARSRSRVRARRLRREAISARSERIPSTAETVERVAIQRELVEAALALDAADREVVVLRYFDGLPPREIAKRLGLSGAAVRSRLSRALAKLRARLDERYGGDGRSWAVLLATVAARGRDGRIAAAAAGSIAMVGAVKWIGAALLLALVILVWRGTSEPEQESEPLVAASDEVEMVAEIEGEAEAENEQGPAPKRTAIEGAPTVSVGVANAEQQAAPSKLVLRGRVLDERGEPIERATMTAIDVLSAPAAASDRDGWVRLVLDWPMSLVAGNDSWAVVEVTGEGLTKVRRQEAIDGPGEVVFDDFRLPAAGAITGCVRDHDGKVPRRAGVYLVAGAEPGDVVLEDLRRCGAGGFTGIGSPRTARVDRDGRYLIEGVPLMSVSVVCGALGRYTSYTPPVEIRRGVTVEAPELILAPPRDENTIRGVVLDEEGRPLNVEVRAFENRGPRNVNPQTMTYSSSGEGSFELMVPAGRRFTLQAGDDRSIGRFILVHDVPSGRQDVVLAFLPRRTLELHVTDAEGDPVPEPRVRLTDERGFGMIERLEWLEWLGEGIVSVELPTVPFRMWVGASSHQSRCLGPFEPAEMPERFDVVLECTGVLSGRVLAGGEPVEGASVHVHVASTGRHFARYFAELYTRFAEERGSCPSFTTDASGRFEIPVGRTGTYTLHAEAEGSARAE